MHVSAHIRISMVVVLLLSAPLFGCGEPQGIEPINLDAPIAPDAISPDPCSGSDPVALMNCLDADRYQVDLEFIAQERPPGSVHWQAVQDLCADRLAGLGFEVERQAYGTGVNVVGSLSRGAGPTILISGHYDHIQNCPGADDNATGIAALFEIGRVMAGAQFAGTLKLACWDEEERGLVGSTAYVERAQALGEDLALMVSIDMIGYVDERPNSQALPENIELLFPEEVDLLRANEFRADFIPMAANDPAGDFARDISRYADLVDLVAVPLVIPGGLEVHPLLRDLSRSDHAPFWAAGYPALLISDSAELRNPNYHCAQGQDTLETLDLGFAIKVVSGILGATAERLLPP